ncbi:Fe-only nitrogenase subunit delta [Anaerosporobacter sp.]
MDDLTKERVELLLDFIMKKCLWQFHSRAWDRERQNENIIQKTTQILCGEPVENDTPEQKCYFVDAAYLAENYKNRFPWVSEIDKVDLKNIMQGLRERLDYLLISGSLNAELTDPHY